MLNEAAINAATTTADSAKSLANIMADPLNNRLLKTLEDFAETLKIYGFHTRVSTDESILQLPLVANEKKEQLIGYFQLWNSWIQPEANDPEPGRIDAKKERQMAGRALDHFGLEASEEFWKTVEDDQIVEVYTADSIQVYRNLNFFKFCGYSLLEISVFEYYNLWERPSTVLKQMRGYAEAVMLNPTPVMRYEIPRHVLLEKRSSQGLTEGFQPRACLCDFRYVGTVTKKNDPRPAGGICSADARLLGQGEDASNIMFV